MNENRTRNLGQKKISSVHDDQKIKKYQKKYWLNSQYKNQSWRYVECIFIIYTITIEYSFLPVESDTQGLEDGEEGCGGGSVGEPGAPQVQVLQLYSNLKSIIQIFDLITQRKIYKHTFLTVYSRWREGECTLKIISFRLIFMLKLTYIQ